jgi:hypothetical protein
MHVIFTGDEDAETDFLGATDAEGRRPSGDDARSLPLPPFTLDLLLELADNERGLSTAFNKFEACILQVSFNKSLQYNHNDAESHRNLHTFTKNSHFSKRFLTAQKQLTRCTSTPGT